MLKLWGRALAANGEGQYGRSRRSGSFVGDGCGECHGVFGGWVLREMGEARDNEVRACAGDGEGVRGDVVRFVRLGPRRRLLSAVAVFMYAWATSSVSVRVTV